MFRSFFLVFVALPGCAQILGVDAYATVEPVTDGAIADATHVEDSSRRDSLSDGSSISDASDSAAPCSSGEAAPTGAVFASATDGDDGANGTATAPVKTIARAVSLAIERSVSSIVLERGTYDEAIALRNLEVGLLIEGGFRRSGAAWSRGCDPSDVTTLQSPLAIAVRVDDVKKRSTLAHLTVVAGASGQGGSSMGVFVRGTSAVTLDDVVVLAAPGGDGAPTPATPVTPSSSCGGFDDCNVGMGAVWGQTGADGGANAGAFSSDGWTPGRGGHGGHGGNGSNGRPGYPGAASFVNECDEDCGGVCAPPPKTTVWGGRGTCGCGGVGGAGGTGGEGGGASVGLFVYGAGAQVEVKRSSITSADGGRGQSGAPGADPSMPTTGAPGAAMPCYVGGCVALKFGCHNAGVSKSIPGGAAGEPGLAGGRGGAGGSGAGGPSIAIVNGPGSSVTIDADTKLSHGAGGAGSVSGFASDRATVP